MKNIFSLLMLVACSVCMNAQVVKMHVWKNGSCTVCPVENVDSITFVVSNTASNYKAVDLGLPSGTLWADRNVGADAPEAYGDYFAWGEVTPKTEYDPSAYKWSKGYWCNLTKYCIDRYYGIVDGKTVLDLEDDAAYQNGVYGRKVTGPNGNSIFLPAAGYRFYDYLCDAGSCSFYWSSSLYGSSSYACNLIFGRGYYDWSHNTRYYGHSVRAVVR